MPTSFLDQTRYAYTPSNVQNAYVEKLTPTGSLAWVKALGEPAGISQGVKVWVDDLGDVYTTGNFMGVADFNPASPGTATFAAQGYNGYIWEMDPAGNFLSAWHAGANAFVNAAVPYRDPVTGARSLYAAGTFSGTANLPTGDSLTSAGGNDSYVMKLNRQLGTLAGTVYNDLNDNGINDDASPLSGWIVSLSQVQNGVTVPTGLSATTDAQGRYTFYDVAPGSYSITATPPAGTSGYTQSAPAAGQPRVAILSAGQFTGGLDFGEFTPNQVKTYSNTTVTKLPVNWLGTSTTSSLTISDSYPIDDLNVKVNITQVKDSQISLKLTAPNGTAVTLFWWVNSNGSNLTNTTFDDAASTPVAAGAAPFTGSFRPRTLLNVLNGKNINGTWKLSVVESGTGNNVLNSWSLVVTGSKSGTASAMAMPAHSSSSVAIAPTSAAGTAVPPTPTVPVSRPSTRAAVTVKAGGAPVPSRVRRGWAASEIPRRPYALYT